MRRVLLTLAAFVAGILLPATNARAAPTPATSTATSAPQTIGIRLVDIPTATADDPRTRIYITDYLNPGTVIHRRVSVRNLSDTAREVAVYTGAASVEDGSFDVAVGHTANELTTWTSVDQPRLTLPPGAEATDTVTIAVPRDASPGEHYAAIWAETSAASSAHGENVVEVSRVGIRVYLSVGPGGAPPPNFAVTSLSSTRLPDGRPVVTAQVHNTGGRALDMTGDLTLSHGPGGLNAGPFSARLGVTLAPGQSEPVTISLDKQLPRGPWTAQVRLRSGITERAARATITFPAHAGATVPGRMFSLAGTGYLILILALAGVLLGMSLLVFTLRRRRRRRSGSRQPA